MTYRVHGRLETDGAELMPERLLEVIESILPERLRGRLDLLLHSFTHAKDRAPCIKLGQGKGTLLRYSTVVIPTEEE